VCSSDLGSLLKLAVELGDLSMVKLLMENGADPEARYGDGETPFLAAAAKGKLKILQYLYARGADRKARVYKETAIALAIRNGRVKTADYLIKMARMGELYGIRELRAAARQGNLELAKKLIAKGADFRETYLGLLTKGGVETPLMAAVSAGKVEMVRYLLETPWINAKDAQDEIGKTALMMAAEKGNTVSMRLLLDAGADMTLRSHSNHTALYYAEQAGQTGAYDLLISEGAKY
jgi:ankyrin repeat protein